MPKRIVAMVASVVAVMAGGWLILAPFALGYRPGRGVWDHTTEVDVWSGVGVVVVALVCLTAALLATVADLRTRGALPAKTRRAARRQARGPQQGQVGGIEQGQAGGIEQGQAGGAEQGQAGGIEQAQAMKETAAQTAGTEQGQAMGGFAAQTVAPPPSPANAAVVAGDRPQADLRDLLTSLVQALLDDTSQVDARPPSTHPAEPPPGAEGDSAARLGQRRWRRTP